MGSHPDFVAAGIIPFSALTAVGPTRGCASFESVVRLYSEVTTNLEKLRRVAVRTLLLGTLAALGLALGITPENASAYWATRVNYRLDPFTGMMVGFEERYWVPEAVVVQPVYPAPVYYRVPGPIYRSYYDRPYYDRPYYVAPLIQPRVGLYFNFRR
jgi:hypothetical protein